MRVRMKVEGADKIARRLQMMSEEMQRTHMREIALAAAKPIEDQAVSNAEAIRRTGTLASDIHIEVEKQTKSRVKLKIGPGEKGWYGRLVEEGHAKVRPGQRRVYRASKKLGGDSFEWGGGHVAPKPWLRPAFDAKQDEAQAVAAREIRRRLKLK